MGLPILTAIGNVKFKEMKTTANGKTMCSFMLSCSEKNQKGEYDKLDLKVVVWEKSAEFVDKYFHDGDIAVVEGKLETNEFTKDDGTKIKTTQFKFPSVSFPPKAFSNNQDVRQVQTVYETIPKNVTIPREIEIPEGEVPF